MNILTARWLVGCETSGRVRDALRGRGHDAYSCDILPSERGTPFHIQGNVLDVLGEGWDGAIFHPPCTRLANSGVRWLAERDLWKELEEACAFFNALKTAPIPKIAIENPIPHKYAVERIGKYDQIVQPYMFGHRELKQTCFWLKGLPPLRPTVADVAAERAATLALPKKESQRVHYASPGKDRWKERSRTYQGIANAMAEQWAGWCTDWIKR